MNSPTQTPTTLSDTERLLDTAEVAAILHLTERQVARLRQSKKLKCVRLTASAVRHTRAEVDAYIAACSNDDAE